MSLTQRAQGRSTRHLRIRKKVMGMPERPRLNVFRSHKHLFVQIINDVDQKTLVGCSTKTYQKQGQLATGGNITAAAQLGKIVAQEAIKRGIKQVVFDRGGYRYHGRVKALADAAREAGLEF
jgi:large subunit ribosomal protein L18